VFRCDHPSDGLIAELFWDHSRECPFDGRDMSLDQFYLPEEGRTRGAFRARFTDLSLPVEPYALGVGVPDTPVAFEYSSGSSMYDWICTEFTSVLLISTELVELMQRASFTGWSTYPVELRDACDEVVPGYTGLSIVGRCGPLDDSNVPIIELPSKRTGLLVPQRRGYSFDIDTWDGSDFFSPARSRMTIVTERVRDVFMKERIKNVAFVRLTEAVRIGTTSVSSL
jgi:hypothetical protein